MRRHVPKYRHFRPRNRGFVEYRGKRIYLPGPYQSRQSIAAYQAFLAKIIAELSPPDPQDPPISIAELVDQYLAWAIGYYGQGTEYGCIFDACQPLAAMYGRTPAAMFGPRALAAVRDAMVAGRIQVDGQTVWQARRPWSRTYINHQVARIKRMFAWGVAQECVPAAVADAIQYLPGLRRGKTTARESQRVRPAAEAVVEATIAKMPPVLAAMVRLQQITGMRSANLCALRPADIDRSRPVWRYAPPRHKSAWRGTTLTVFLGPKAQAILAPYLDRAPDAYCFSPAEAWAQRAEARRAARKTPVPPSQQRRRRQRRQRPHGPKYSVASYRRAVRYACRLAGVPPWTPHQLRHHAATAIRSRYGLEGAQVYLGHTRADVTQIYAERDLGLAEQIAAAIG